MRSRARCRPSRPGGAARGRRGLTSLPESRPGRGRPPGASAQAGGCGPVCQGRGPRGAPPRPHGHVLAVRPARRSFGPAPPLRGNCRLRGGCEEQRPGSEAPAPASPQGDVSRVGRAVAAARNARAHTHPDFTRICPRANAPQPHTHLPTCTRTPTSRTSAHVQALTGGFL